MQCRRNQQFPASRGKSGAVLKPDVSIGAEPVRTMSMTYQPRREEWSEGFTRKLVKAQTCRLHLDKYLSEGGFASKAYS